MKERELGMDELGSAVESQENERKLLGTYKTYEVRPVFRIVAHSEEQAQERWEKFTDFIYHLTGMWDVSHEAVQFVHLMGPGSELKFVEEAEVYDNDLTNVGIGNNVDYLLEWISPDAGKDFDPYRSAHRVIFGEDGEE